MNILPRIAVIDDQPEFLDLFARYFKSQYDVVGFTDYRAAASAIRRGEFDAVVLDILMPEKSGLDVLKEIKEMSNVPVLMITATKSRDNIITALRLGADDYLEKPFDFEVARQRLDKALRKRPIALPSEVPPSLELAPGETLKLGDVDNRVRMVMAVVERDYANHVTLHHLSNMLNLAPYYLGRLIKQETGLSFKEILARYRMKKAADMLLSTQLRIKEVARSCGFANFHYFCRMFNRFYGHPASHHRKMGGRKVAP